MVKYATSIEAERVGFGANFHRMQSRDKEQVGLWQARRITEMRYYVSRLVEGMGALKWWRAMARRPDLRPPANTYRRPLPESWF